MTNTERAKILLGARCKCGHVGNDHWGHKYPAQEKLWIDGKRIVTLPEAFYKRLERETGRKRLLPGTESLEGV